MSYLTNEEICFLYRTAKDKDDEIFILGELTASDPETIIEVLKDADEYELKGIQQCIKCKQMYIEKGRAHICPSCKRKASIARRKNGKENKMRIIQ